MCKNILLFPSFFLTCVAFSAFSKSFVASSWMVVGGVLVRPFSSILQRVIQPELLPMALTAAASTSSAAANSEPHLPFWNASSREWSGKLWSCTKTACAAADSNCWSSSFKRLTSASWLTARIQIQTTTCSPSTLSV